MYAVIESGGKQHRIEEGETLQLEKLDATALDDANHRIMGRVNKSGEAFITHTVVRGRTCLRVSIGNLKTTHPHVQRLWELLQEAAAYEDGALS